jgi:hypothetical protein
MGDVIIQVQNAAGEWVEAKPETVTRPIPQVKIKRPLPKGVRIHRSLTSVVASCEHDNRVLRVVAYTEDEAITAMESWLHWEKIRA